MSETKSHSLYYIIHKDSLECFLSLLTVSLVTLLTSKSVVDATVLPEYNVHGKFMLKSNFQHFTESLFTSVLCRKFLFKPIYVISAISLEITLKLASFFL